MPAAEHADLDPRRAAFVAFGAGRAPHRRLWAALVLPDPNAPRRAARAVTVYLEQGWSVVRVTAHSTLIDQSPADLLARLVRRRPDGYRSIVLPVELQPGAPGSAARLARIFAVAPGASQSIALGD